MIETTLDKAGAAAVLKLSGPINIQQAQKLHAALLEIVANAQHLTVHMDGVTAVDLSCLQLLCSAHRRLVRSGGELRLEGNMVDGMREAVLNAGFSACVGEKDQSGLWTGEAN